MCIQNVLKMLAMKGLRSQQHMAGTTNGVDTVLLSKQVVAGQEHATKGPFEGSRYAAG